MTQATIEITLNGETRQVAAGRTVAGLLADLGLHPVWSWSSTTARSWTALVTIPRRCVRATRSSWCTSWEVGEPPPGGRGRRHRADASAEPSARGAPGSTADDPDSEDT